MVWLLQNNRAKNTIVIINLKAFFTHEISNFTFCYGYEYAG